MYFKGGNLAWKTNYREVRGNEATESWHLQAMRIRAGRRKGDGSARVQEPVPSRGRRGGDSWGFRLLGLSGWTSKHGEEAAGTEEPSRGFKGTAGTAVWCCGGGSKHSPLSSCPPVPRQCLSLAKTNSKHCGERNPDNVIFRFQLLAIWAKRGKRKARIWVQTGKWLVHRSIITI